MQTFCALMYATGGWGIFGYQDELKVPFIHKIRFQSDSKFVMTTIGHCLFVSVFLSGILTTNFRFNKFRPIISYLDELSHMLSQIELKRIRDIQFVLLNNNRNPMTNKSHHSNKYWKMKISEAMYLTLSPIVYLERFFGLCPLSFNRQNSYFILGKSQRWQIYSNIFAALLVIWGTYGYTAELQIPFIRRIRFKSISKAVMTVTGHTLFSAVFISGLFTSNFRFGKFRQIISYMQEVDELVGFSNTMTVRRNFKRMIAFSATLAMTSVAISSFKWGVIVVGHQSPAAVIFNYIPLHLTYVYIIVLQLFHASIVYLTSLRIKEFNNYMEFGKRQKSDMKIETIDMLVQYAETEGYLKLYHRGDTRQDNEKKDVLKQHTVLTLEEARILLKAHRKIYQAVKAINNFFGPIVFILMMTYLFHLAEDPYEYYLKSLSFTGSEFMRYFMYLMHTTSYSFHLFKMTLLVEPSQKCIRELRQSYLLLHKRLAEDIPDAVRQELLKLLRQLEDSPIEFTIAGIASISRVLVLKVAGVIATYLVVIFQTHG